MCKAEDAANERLAASRCLLDTCREHAGYGVGAALKVIFCPVLDDSFKDMIARIGDKTGGRDGT